MPTDVSLTTNPELLRRLGDWRDGAAWLDFIQRYEALILVWCRAGGLGPEAAQEVGQAVLRRLAVLMRESRYDASRSFRRWLSVIVRNKVHEYRREHRRHRLDPLAVEPTYLPVDADEEGERHPLLEKARQVQAAVQAAVNPKAWDVFWRTDIEGAPLVEVATSLGMRYHTAFMARKRVRSRLAQEGRGFLLGAVSGPAHGGRTP